MVVLSLLVRNDLLTLPRNVPMDTVSNVHIGGPEF